MANIRRSTRERKPVKRDDYLLEDSELEANGVGEVEEAPSVDQNQDYDDSESDETVDSAFAQEGGETDVADATTPSESQPGTTISGTPKRKSSFRLRAAQRKQRATAPRVSRSEASSSHPTQLHPHLSHPPGTTYPLPLDVFPTDERHTRQYRGPLPRNSTGYALVQHLGGPDRGDVSRLAATVARWYDYDVLPNKVPGSKNDPMGSLWVPEDFESLMAENFTAWFERWRANVEKKAAAGEAGQAGQSVRRLEKHEHERDRYKFESSKDLFVQLGLLDEPQLVRIKPGQSFPVDVAGRRLDDVAPSVAKKEPPPAGWLFDTGGIVLAMDWLPKGTPGDQILAMSVIPHSDQEIHRDAPAVSAAVLAGGIQLWSFPRQQHPENGSTVPARLSPRRIQMTCVDWGRVRRLKWCPVAMPAAVTNGGLGLLAVLTGDGVVRILEVAHSPSRDCVFEKVERPMVALSLSTEASAPATAFAWVMINRICVGHEDGSITLWSLDPLHVLSRHAAQHTQVITIQSAFPSSPYLIAVSAVGGLAKLIDLASPSSETATAGTHAVTTEPGLMQWSDHMQAFVGKVPSSNPQSHGIVLLPARHFGGLGKRVIKPDSAPSCLAVGALHPFLLTGLVDGSLWVNNPTRLVFAPKSTRVSFKLRLFQHEFRPVGQWTSTAPEDEAEALLRGAARILTGWAAEPNRTPHVPKGKVDDGDGDEDGSQKDNKSTKKKTAAVPNPSNEGGEGVVFEPLSRITAVAWNPNEGFACWAAVAMGSGLVKVMDLGLVD